MNYAIFATGCQQNESDARRLEFMLDQLGSRQVNEDRADMIFVLACSVRQKAVDRIFGKLKKWAGSAKKPKVTITGCVLPADRLKLLPKVKTIVKIDDLLQQLTSNDYFDPKGYLTISFGCNNFCTYCAVPFTRGRERPRSKKEIISEAKRAAQAGTKKLLLLGQNVNNYPDFVQLLSKLEKIPDVDEINFLSPHPSSFDSDLIDWLKISPKAPKTLHLPVQSGSDKILKKMNRHYTAREYLKLIDKIKKARPDIQLTTDIIVGFPGETLADFKKTLDLVKKLMFSKAYVAKYSPRPGTAAAKLFPDVISPAEKKRRWEIVNQLVNR